MKLASYWPLQLMSWTAVYLLFCVMILNRPLLIYTEFLYGAILISCTATGSHLTRLMYKRYLLRSPVWLQGMCLITASVLVASLATVVLIVSVFIVSATDFGNPIPASQRLFVISNVFWGNVINMLALMLLWSALYFAVQKVRQLKQTRELLQQSQLDVLINQLKPHFLFNSINNIRALILEDQEKARDMLSSLADMLRYSLSSQSDIKVPVCQEMQFVQDYVALCSIQFEQALQFSAHIEEDCQQALIPRMLLQFCVENAFKHGISQLPDGGKIDLFINRNGQQLVIRLFNDGQIRCNSDTTGIGLRNIQQRLKLLYGEQADLQLSLRDKRVLTHIQLPLECLQ
ncbi:sensor histidine kinase [Lacimicrobium alkaliphilum]|uniref:Transcriptional regulator n=1 Tax=Lacimicrobium alkaliphilum TaxID=1526571 RepID=A0A0U2QN31_9ALTE|nr:histidine kinase [Lacimicrobium alkaliphilum]ALS98939.1 transcriptional regulator [Lacimicrobium alkaliphilum]